MENIYEINPIPGSSEDILGENGLLAKRMSNFTFRPQQLELAKRIENLLQGGNCILAAEAPPGIGKTYAMLVPAILDALNNDRTVLYLTSGITLQEQLIERDIPNLLDIMGVHLPYGLLKGRGNYACIAKASDLSTDGFLAFGDDRGQASMLIKEWLLETSDGDMANLNLPDNHPARDMIASSRYSCLGPLCKYRDICFPLQAMKEITNYRIIVANYHLFFAYPLGLGMPFPAPFDVILCDEAHRMTDAAKSVSAIESSGREWSRLLKRVPKMESLPQLFYTSIANNMDSLKDEVSALGMLESQFFATVDSVLPDGKLFKKLPQEIITTGKELIHGVKDIIDNVSELRNTIEEEPEAETYLANNAEFFRWAEQLDESAKALEWCISVEHYPQWAYWRDGPVLKSVPVVFNDTLPGAFDFENGLKMIAMSATMTIDDSFEYWANESGVSPDEVLLLDSPFDLPNQMEINVVNVGVPVTHQEYDDRIARVVRYYSIQNKGATLVLLSSKRLMSRVAGYMQKHAETDGFRVLVQGQQPRTELLNLFRSGEPTVLIGSVSFREGVDVPGDALTQVIIDRIPFPHPEDPQVEARNALDGRSSFMNVTLPTAKMHLRQAVGRLIRSSSDKGKVVILDARVLDKLDWKIFNSLPKVPIKKINVIN